jgi:hypothetical protein
MKSTPHGMWCLVVSKILNNVSEYPVSLPWKEGTKFLRNVGTSPLNYTASHSRRQYSRPPPRTPQIRASQVFKTPDVLEVELCIGFELPSVLSIGGISQTKR